MEIKSFKFLVIVVLTFLIVFLMKYVGNTNADKLENAIMNGVGGMIGITIGMFFYNRSKNDKNPPQHFD